MTPYHFSVTVHGDFDNMVKITHDALTEHGFAVVSEVDMAATLNEQLGVNHENYMILGACNPGFANAALNQEPSVGVLFPSNVVIRSTVDDAVVIDFLDPAVVLSAVEETGIHKIADEVRTRLEMTRDAIARASAVARAS